MLKVNKCATGIFSPLFQGTKYITRPVPPPPPCHMYLASCQVASCQLKLASCRLPASCQVKLASCKLLASAGSSCQLKLASCKLPASCWQVLAQVASSSWQVSSCQQVAWSSWQASCWLKLSIFQVKLTRMLSAIGGTGDHELSS